RPGTRPGAAALPRGQRRGAEPRPPLHDRGARGRRPARARPRALEEAGRAASRAGSPRPPPRRSHGGIEHGNVWPPGRMNVPTYEPAASPPTPPSSPSSTRTPMPADSALLAPADRFERRHNGPAADGIAAMLDTLGLDSLAALADAAVPDAIRTERPLGLPAPLTEAQLLARARDLAAQNSVYRSYIGMGYYGTITPPTILRNVFENPGWYTQYTPYQAEIAQGRLEALLNFQTAVADLTGMEIANASLLDEGTAAAEAMSMFFGQARGKRPRFLVAASCHPQTIAVVQGRAEPIGVEVVVGDPSGFEFGDDVFGALLQYPATDGAVEDYAAVCAAAHEAGAYVAVATDLLALT